MGKELQGRYYTAVADFGCDKDEERDKASVAGRAYIKEFKTGQLFRVSTTEEENLEALSREKGFKIFDGMSVSFTSPEPKGKQKGRWRWAKNLYPTETSLIKEERKR